MKTRYVTLLLSGIFFVTGNVAVAQITIPPTAKQFEKRGINGGATTGATVVKREAPKPKVVTFTAVSKNRPWTNTEGKAIMARLLAFSAPEDPKDGPTEIIRDGKVRLLLEKAKAPTEYPLKKLSQPDQLFVKSIAQAASKRPPAKTKPPVKIEESKKPE